MNLSEPIPADAMRAAALDPVSTSELKIIAPAETRKVQAWRPPVAWQKRYAPVLALAIALCGIALRLWMPAGFKGEGLDARLYRAYLVALDQHGLGDYDLVTAAFLADQRQPKATCKLPPTRFAYVFCGWMVKRGVFGSAPPVELKTEADFARDPAMASLRLVSLGASVALLILSGVFAWRLAGPMYSAIVLALMGVAPLQLHMAEHALIDGFFALWATLCLWTLWESLRKPGNRLWNVLFGASLACMVLTKENAFFVYVALAALLVANRWARFGVVNRGIVIAAVAGPAFGVAVLVYLAGGFSTLAQVYRVLVEKAEHLDYAIQFGDGTWQRYLIDEIAMSPAVICLAIGAAFSLARRKSDLLFLAGFVVFSYTLMCNVRYGMNLRYGVMWDFPLRTLAAAQLIQACKWVRRWPNATLATALALLCAYDLWQYQTFFIREGLYELPTQYLLQAERIVK